MPQNHAALLGVLLKVVPIDLLCLSAVLTQLMDCPENPYSLALAFAAVTTPLD